MDTITRRNFVAGSAGLASLLALAGCNNGAPQAQAADDNLPADGDYPIDPDGDDVKAQWTSEKVRKDGWVRVTNPDGGATLGVMDEGKVIQVGGLAFRDMDGSGKLDLWEDWRQPAEKRAAALAEALTAEEIIPLMRHNGMMSANADLDEDSINTLKQGMRAGVSRASANEDSYADAIAWINAVQAWCEANDAHGIPYMNSTDPYQLYDIPDNHCLASTFNPIIWKKAGRYTGRAWRLTGARVNLGPQVDVGSNVLYCRMGGSICEDPATNRDLAKYFGGGMQSTWADDECTDDKGWGDESVALMFKHYVGAGAVEGGRNDHNDAGKFDIFPDDNFNAHLVPFLDGGLKLESSTGQMAAVMPNYGIAYSEDEKYGPNWGGAYNKRNLSILRNAGWDGMITTDWQILRATDFGDRAHGVKEFSEPERFKMLLESGVDQVGGDFAPEIGTEGYKLYEQQYGKDEALARVRESARHIFTVMNRVQLFDQPYSDRDRAAEVLKDEKAAAFAQEASNAAIVMLKNKGNIISKAGIAGKPKAYIPQKFDAGSMFNVETKFELAIDETVASELFDVVTDTVGEPTGSASPMSPGQTAPSEPITVYQASDCTRADAAQLKDCEYVVMVISSPDTGAGEGGSMFSNEPVPEDQKYLPISLQYRPYTAEVARNPSYAGDVVDGAKENRSYNGRSVSASNESDLDLLLSIREAAPNAKIILIVEASNNAQCFHEIEPAADVILWSWASSGRNFGQAYGRILKGEVEPSGLLPCQMPKDMATVEESLEDVPRDLDCYTDSEGHTYDFTYGLNWSGVIDDDRVKTYSAPALREPECEVKPDED